MNRTALVTGGTRGIGLGIAQELARKGFNLALCGMREADDIQPVISTLSEHGTQVRYFQADVSSAQARRLMVEGVRNEFGQLNVLVNNAGVAPKERNDLLDASEESFQWVLKVNLQGPYFLTQEVARWMAEQKKSLNDFQASIIFISSISATIASTNRGEYCISKAGIAMAAQLWSVRLAEFGIPVYEVRPGIIRTDMTAGVIEKYDRLIDEGLLLQPRWGTPDDVGKGVAALATGVFPYSTGEVFMVDGGMTVLRL